MSATDTSPEDAPRAPGRIFTFYSYKGGTGRSMALANVAWILASNGQRVLVIDWDLEAPGLHRYFRPFLPDPELSDTPGLIDFFVHFTEAARIQKRAGESQVPSGRPWYYDRADLLRYSVPLDHDFPKGGLLDFVGAGQQGPSYGGRVNSFHWSEFYEKLGGGTFLEAMKAQLRDQYDYVLIDSRTGLSDTSGICTVQMPDELVVCFTLNRQSIQGAAASADSADAQRRLPNGAQGLRIWPVPTRVDLSEKDRLETARLSARERFAPFLWHVPVAQRNEYWGSIEVLYFPYYAYEEVLATIADAPQQSASLLYSMERLTARLTGGRIKAMPRYAPGAREVLKALYDPPRTQMQARAGRFFLSYATVDQSTPIVARVAEAIDQRFGADTAFWSDRIPLGAVWADALRSGLEAAEAVLVFVGPRWLSSSGSPLEVEVSRARRKSIVPVVIHGLEPHDLPPELREFAAARLREETFAQDLRRLVDQLARSFDLTPAIATIDADDPHRGQFGGRSESDGRRLAARVTAAENEWFNVDLAVQSTGDTPLEGEVLFHLHPTFRPSVVSVSASGGIARLQRIAWGAFTVGVLADQGRTRLELNLAELPDAPPQFRER